MGPTHAPPRLSPDFGGIKQRLRGHAPAQEAQPADFFPALNDGRFQTCARRCPRRCVTGAATAENGHVVIKLFHDLKWADGRNFQIQMFQFLNCDACQIISFFHHEQHHLPAQPARNDGRLELPAALH